MTKPNYITIKLIGGLNSGLVLLSSGLNSRTEYEFHLNNDHKRQLIKIFFHNFPLKGTEVSF